MSTRTSFGGRLFRQMIGIPMGTNCVDPFLYSYENEILDNMIRSGHRRLARSFNLCYRYIDDLIVFNNKKFLDYLKEIHHLTNLMSVQLHQPRNLIFQHFTPQFHMIY